jgi:hypothetical protein
MYQSPTASDRTRMIGGSLAPNARQSGYAGLRSRGAKSTLCILSLNHATSWLGAHLIAESQRLVARILCAGLRVSHRGSLKVHIADYRAGVVGGVQPVYGSSLGDYVRWTTPTEGLGA